MKNLFTYLITAVLLLPLAAIAEENHCISCHRDFEDEADGPSYKIVRDIHFQKGLSCVDCHGGDASLEDMDDVRATKSWRGVPNHRQVPEFCARCHSDPTYMHEHNPTLPTDQLEKYKTSVHGQRLYQKNDQKVANCISCHTVHEIGDAKMPHSSTHPLNVHKTCGKCHASPEHMKGYKIPTDQVSDYVSSVHGIALLQKQDLAAPTCNDCHGNHGAAPPGVSSLAAVCGNCHALEAELFISSPHDAAFTENDFPMCETCHSNHAIHKPSDAMIGPTAPALCVECHEPDDGTKGIKTATTIKDAIIQLVTAHDKADTLLEEAKVKGMMTTDEEFRLNEVRQALIQTRTLVHSFNADSVVPKAEEGMKKAEEVEANSANLIDEYYFRRKGLGLATIFITILAIGLWLKIRKLD